MRRTPPSIRITQNDRQEYARLVRNTKAKIRRANQKYGIDLSTQIQIPSIEDFTTRNQFNEFKQKQKSFTNRNNKDFQFKKNEFGVVATKRELEEIQRNTKKAQEIADKLRSEANEKPFISGGKEQGTVGQRMMQMGKPNTAGITRPPDFDFEKIRTRAQLEKKMKNMEERSDEEFFDKRMEQMKENLTKLIEETFHSDADELVKRLREIPPDDFYEMFLMFDELNFDYIYTTESDGSETNNWISKISSYLDRYDQGRINMDLKGF